jgi:hypothetical protein
MMNRLFSALPELPSSDYLHYEPVPCAISYDLSKILMPVLIQNIPVLAEFS